MEKIDKGGSHTRFFKWLARGEEGIMWSERRFSISLFILNTFCINYNKASKKDGCAVGRARNRKLFTRQARSLPIEQRAWKLH